MAEIPAMRRMLWAVRRELWENRSLYVAPLAVTALFLMGFTIGVFHLPAQIRVAAALDPMKQNHAVAEPYEIAAGLMMLTGVIVAVFYCLDALYGERRDRSILFWKSLPVSDLTTVLAKASIPLVVLPLLCIAVTIVAQFGMLLLSSAVVAGSGQSVAFLWTRLSLARMSVLLFYHWTTVHVLWHAPIYGYLLLVSAAAPRTPVIWAFLPPLAIAFLEKIAFNTKHFVNFLWYRLAGNGMEALAASGAFPTAPMTEMTPGRFLGTADLWIGLVVTAIFLAVAVRLRRNRGPI